MDYGLYLSASGIVSASYRQDVISNNLANSETVGFKRDLALFQQRQTEARNRGVGSSRTNRDLEALGGGLLASPTCVDFATGQLEPTHSPRDAAIVGRGFFAVQDDGQVRLTRDGRFALDREGHLILSNATGQKVLNHEKLPIRLNNGQPFTINDTGEIQQGGTTVAKLSTFDVPDPQSLKKLGGNLFEAADPNSIALSQGVVRGGLLERSNVEPATELSSLMETQRILEANANMIRYQDQMLSRLCTDVGKIG